MHAALSYSTARFEAEMGLIKDEEPEAFEWLMSKGIDHWARSRFRTGPKCEISLNNLCESFNGTRAILLARQKPILSMLERIRLYILRRFTKKRLAGEKWKSEVGPRIFKVIEANKVLSAENIAHWAGDLDYQVSNMYGSMYKVDLGHQTCSCGRWDLSGTLML